MTLLVRIVHAGSEVQVQIVILNHANILARMLHEGNEDQGKYGKQG